MNKTRLKKYAKLIAKCGVNVKRGQEVMITAELDQPEFVKMVVDECYKAGASKVSVDWTYQPITKSTIKYCSEKVLSTLDTWQVEKWEHQAKVLPCKIYLISEDPDGLAGIDQKKFAKASAAKSKIIKPIRNRMENKYQWCIAAVPGEKWAKKVFPGERASVAVEKLWEAILSTSRVYDDPIHEWELHNANLAKKCAYLNGLKIRELHYKSSNGTDLKVGLIPEALFCAGGEKAAGSGIYFNPNIPSEETFTSPKKGEAEGIVYSSMPLSYGGQLIDKFWMKFEGGKVVDVGADANEAMLREMVSMDEGAAYLGEVALVPYSSPIRESGILFYNTLFDENAACHLAVGRGFSNVLRDYEKYSEEEAHELGINDSIIHVDFMIGTKDLDITAICEGGKAVKIFENGEWAF
ncbi:MAG: aminopeptidase [Ruminococcaceae bacterium]|nr:aminopeptidase [Oscillospiraceae bacterium]